MTTSNTIARRVHDATKIQTWREIATRYPDQYEFLRQYYLDHFYSLGTPSRQAHNRSRQAAYSDLSQMYPEEYKEIRSRWVKHFREKFGWVDERPAANRLHAKEKSAQARNDKGQWTKKGTTSE